MHKLEELRISPAPWKIGDAIPYRKDHVVYTENHRHDDGSRHNKVIAICNQYFEERVADAHLIAAAPNMYQKSYELIDAFDRREMKPEHINALRAALASAAGEEVAKR